MMIISLSCQRKKMGVSLNSIWVFLFLFLLSLLSGCFSNKKLTIRNTAALLEEIGKASSKQTDLRIIREGMPAYLLLIDGMVEAVPDNEQLLISAAQTYSSYASLFVEDQDKEYGRLLFGKGKSYALRALERRGLKDPLRKPFDEFKEELNRLGKKDIPYIFWSATCWANWISLNLDSMEAMAELPRVEWMMRKVLEIDEGFYFGGPHLFMGIWYASRPKVAGGDLKRAQGHFLKAIDLGKGKFLMAYVYYANYYARQVLDKDLFVSTLEAVLKAPIDIAPELTLLNTIAKKKAQELKGRVEEFFE